MSEKQVLDMRRIPVEEFDVLKVFHFVGCRRKKHYMYKVAVTHNGRLYGSHISKNTLTPDYPLWTAEGKRAMNDTEIVQSLNWRKLCHRRIQKALKGEK